MNAVTTLRTPETDEQRIAREARLDVADDMAWELIGGCASMAIVADRTGVDLDDDLEASILNRAFQCHGCGWWHSVEELNNLTERELCDSCHAEENDVTDDRTTSSAVDAPPPGRGGIDASAILHATLFGGSPSLVMIMTDREWDPMDVLRMADGVRAENPDAQLGFMHVGC